MEVNYVCRVALTRKLVNVFECCDCEGFLIRFDVSVSEKHFFCVHDLRGKSGSSFFQCKTVFHPGRSRNDEKSLDRSVDTNYQTRYGAIHQSSACDSKRPFTLM